MLVITDNSICVLNEPDTFSGVPLILNKCNPKMKDKIIMLLFCHKYDAIFNKLANEIMGLILIVNYLNLVNLS